MNTALNVANWFLSQDEMTHKKVQKLTYYAQAWYCALYDGTPMFEDEIQAWIHGPVVVGIYPEFADYRWEPIPRREQTNSNFNEKELEILESVYATYGKFTGDQLERLTHSESPWIEARGDLEPWEPCTNPISISSMRTFYAREYARSQND